MKRAPWRAVAAVLLVAILAGGTAFAADKVQPTPQKPLKLRLGFEDPVDITKPEAAYAMVFKSIVESRTNGAVLVDIFGHSVLGGSKAMLEMVKSGSLDLCIQTGAMAAYYPPFQVISLPYLFKSEDIAWWVFDHSDYWKGLSADLTKKTGLRLLGMGQNGVRHFSNNTRPIHSPADMKGIKFRVMQSPIFVKFVEALGAKAVPIAWAELYTALQTKVVDGQENPLAIIELGKIHEVQKYLTLDGHIWSEDALFVNNALFESLPKEIQVVFETAGRQGALADRSAETVSTMITSMKTISKGMQIYVPTDKEKRQFIDLSQTPVLQWLKGEVGAAPVDGMLKAVKDAEQALGY